MVHVNSNCVQNLISIYRYIYISSPRKVKELPVFQICFSKPRLLIPMSRVESKVESRMENRMGNQLATQMGEPDGEADGKVNPDHRGW